MTALLAAEARRFTARRLLLILVGLYVLAALVTGGVRFSASGPLTADEVLTAATAVAGGAMSFLGVIFGASFVGAEWGQRTMETLLTWEPRRDRVLGAKLAVGAAGLFVVGALVVLFYGLVHAPAAVARGTRGFDGEFVRDFVGTCLKGGGIAAFAGTFTMAWAMVFRNTAGAIVVPYLYLTLLEPLLGGLRPGWRDWLMGPNLQALVGGRFLGFDAPSTAHAAGMLAAYGAGFVLLAYAAFLRRDIT